MRQDALLQPHDEDDGKLQPLGGMQRDQRDGVVALLLGCQRAALAGLRGVRSAHKRHIF